MVKTIYTAPLLLRKMLFVAYLSGIIFVSLLPSKDLPSIPLFYGADKLIHFFLYAGLSWLALWAFNPVLKKKRVAFVFIILSVFGVLLEVVQLTMGAGRSFSVGDIAADVAGVATGIAACLFLFREFRQAD
ncbi:hypothetical protein MNBD_BACTEROID01-1823 [hydrothermal vent metagenome]|uniref:VanZ-like domain-containing protein n=1 Tax=hydrothermal vent metagenome TaxID=652676 RepID=A0A3B0U5N3_9ZZZZ